MLKKLIVASAAFALFACSDDNGGGGLENPNLSSSIDLGEPSSSSIEADTPSSSSEDIEISSSSSEEDVSSGSSEVVLVEKLIAGFNKPASSEIFGTFPYGYTLKASKPEDLTLFWDIDDPDCPVEAQTKAPPSKCELDKTDAILQNTLTNQDAELRYKIDGTNEGKISNFSWGIILLDYNLTKAGDQAALGLDAGAAPNDISLIGAAKGFNYRYKGGEHEFRAVTGNDNDFWYITVPASEDFGTATILANDFAGMGSLDGAPFDISKVKKFLWVVEYSKTESKNQGTLLIDYLNALMEQ